ncbi:hypothetical protein Caci_3308 [Catenulispora acidiphila DSM 44928]|uniref:Uncharacterized protein n=1 Tax=Catenulispora acidiphila (strain DSM 44928 / JCM 14897 / NBRC 102108 / NRRL B-24433 / ID139908) TaxID=479433 RepID=C7Q7M2_CATAD|nr:hypothetical protein [Catenulispora acidiphila]ACU72215.1 hypothetical protein Caci_3308 [Catenulispora acidiphila DSM 44928]
MGEIVRRFGRSAAVVAALALAAGSAAACSSSGSTSGGGGGGAGSGSFKAALKNVHATAQTSNSIEYGDTAQVTKLNGGTTEGESGPFAGLLGVGADQLRGYSELLPEHTGFDYTTGSTAISFGTAPNTVQVLYGTFDPAAIGAKLAAWGYKSSDRGNGVTAWVFEDDHKIDMSKLDPSTGVGPGMTGWLNVVWVSKTSIVYGGATSDLAAAVPAQGKALADDPVVGPLADCLGSPLAAFVITDQKQIQNSKVSAIALGVTGTSASDLRMEICASAPDAAGAQAFATDFTKAVSSGKDLITDEPWSHLMTDPKTSVLGGANHIAQLSAKPTETRAGSLVVGLVEKNDFLGLLGLPTPAARVPAGGTDTETSPTSS